MIVKPVEKKKVKHMSMSMIKNTNKYKNKYKNMIKNMNKYMSKNANKKQLFVQYTLS